MAVSSAPVTRSTGQPLANAYVRDVGATSEQHRAGREYLAAVTDLLRRGRKAHDTKGLFEPAELQYWWGIPRTTDDLPQLFWFDDSDRPVAAAILTAFSDGMQLDPIVLPDASPEWTTHVVECGLRHATAHGYDAVHLEVDRDDEVVCELLARRGFTIREDGLVESWMLAADRPPISPARDDYRLSTRLDTMDRPHHLVKRGAPESEERLRQTSLYRPEFDLVVLVRFEAVVAHGLFWLDPETSTGVVEPMRTEDDHQRQGLARHVLTSGVDLLANAGAERIKICFEANNEAARDLYLDVGFQAVKQTDVWAGPTQSST